MIAQPTLACVPFQTSSSIYRTYRYDPCHMPLRNAWNTNKCLHRIFLKNSSIERVKVFSFFMFLCCLLIIFLSHHQTRQTMVQPPFYGVDHLISYTSLALIWHEDGNLLSLHVQKVRSSFHLTLESSFFAIAKAISTFRLQSYTFYLKPSNFSEEKK